MLQSDILVRVPVLESILNSNTAVRVKGCGHKPWELVERTEGNVYQTEIRITRVERCGDY
jgi:hypothetical protein